MYWCRKNDSEFKITYKSVRRKKPLKKAEIAMCLRLENISFKTHEVGVPNPCVVIMTGR